MAEVSKTGKQHVDYYKKLLERKAMLPLAYPGPVYVPFIGDGDIAFDLYKDKYQIYGADLDFTRLETARSRLPSNTVLRCEDCNQFVFKDLQPPVVFSIADFDAYCDPWEPFRNFWTRARYPKRVVLFFTDGHRQAILRGHHLHAPDGTKRHVESLAEVRKLNNFYWAQVVKPWFVEYIRPYRMMKHQFYLRGTMFQLACVVEDPTQNSSDLAIPT